MFVLFAFATLTHAFVTGDFSVSYVAQHSNSRLPMEYRVAAVWGGHEGSLLLWALILSGWTVAVALRSRRLPEPVAARVLGAMGLVSVGFLAFLLFASNPFVRLLPPALEGRDLNPLLQDPGMVFHPPLLYMGYVGFSVAFAFAIAAAGGRIDAEWARWARPWTTSAWLFLTLGIALGSFCAYYEVGWGGWWFWDPVENASFMPWLVGTALLHSLAVTGRRGAFPAWTVLLARARRAARSPMPSGAAISHARSEGAFDLDQGPFRDAPLEYGEGRTGGLFNMMTRAMTVFLLLAMAALPVLAQGNDARKYAEEARKVVDQIVQQTQNELTKAMEASGPLRAIIVCKYSVPEIASSISRRSGWRVSRVSAKPRNPALGTPDAWERKVLADFDARAQRGEKVEAMQHAEIVAEGGFQFFRYMRALPMTAACTVCHGPVEQLSPAVKAQLAVEYPHDRAVGYRVGQVRGAVTVKRPLD